MARAGTQKPATRTLILLRHAKSSWLDPSQADFDRPLAPRGERDAPAMGRWLAASGAKPAQILCSPSARTRATLAAVAPFLAGPTPAVSLRKSLYLASAPALLRTLRATPYDVRCLMLVGHNPGLHELAVSLAGDGEPPDIRALSIKFPTAAVAILSFAGPWHSLAPGQASLDYFATPKRLRKV